MREREAWTMNGFVGILAIIILLASTIFSFIHQQIFIGIICLIIAILLGSGITLIQPNQSVVVIFLGKYMGSIRQEGIVITVPFSIRRTISLRVRNFNSTQLKVNDINGNPIEIAAVIVFKVVDSAKAVLDRKSTRLNSSHVAISYAVFCLKKKKLIDHIPYVEQRLILSYI